MYTLRYLIFVICAAALSIAAAAGPVPLFELITTADARDVEVGLDLSLLRRAPEQLSIQLPDGRTLVASRHGLQSHGSDGFSWFGELDGDPRGGSASLHLYHGRVFGVVRPADGAAYELSTDGEGVHHLRALPAAEGDGCGLADPPSPLGIVRHADGDLTSLTAASDSQVDCAGMANKALTLIDVLVLYPMSFAGQAQQVQDYAVSQIAEANQIMLNSLVRIRYRLAKVAPITGLQPPGPTQDQATSQVLDWLNGQFDDNPNTPPTEVELLAAAYGADMLSVVIPPHPNRNCGIANLPEKITVNQQVLEVMYPSSELFADKAFTAVELNCGLADFTFAHELGHTYGMRHDDEPRTSRELYPWAYGRVLPISKVATVMGCFDPKGACSRVSTFSNPDVLILGEPAGEHSPSPTQAFNACVAALRAGHYGGIRQPPPSAPPNLAITSPVEGGAVAVGQSFNLVASASDPEDGSLAASVRWTSDREGGLLGVGSPLPVTLTRGGIHLITAEVTDSSGTTLRHSIRLRATELDPPRVWIDSPSHSQTVSRSFQVVGWATDASGVTSVSFRLDGVPINLGRFVYGLSRNDVCTAHADLHDPNCPFVGFRGTLDTTEMSNGGHVLRATVLDLHGNFATFDRFFPTSNETTKSFLPTDDAWGNALAPNSNSGSDPKLQLRSHATGFGRHAYFKFAVSGITRWRKKAVLRLLPAGATALTTCTIYRLATTSWQEETLTWNNAPLDPLSSFTISCAGSPILLDVTSMILGDGTYTLGLVAPDVAGQAVWSKEGGLLVQPSLEVTY